MITNSDITDIDISGEKTIVAIINRGPYKGSIGVASRYTESDHVLSKTDIFVFSLRFHSDIIKITIFNDFLDVYRYDIFLDNGCVVESRVVHTALEEYPYSYDSLGRKFEPKSLVSFSIRESGVIGIGIVLEIGIGMIKIRCITPEYYYTEVYKNHTDLIKIDSHYFGDIIRNVIY